MSAVPTLSKPSDSPGPETWENTEDRLEIHEESCRLFDFCPSVGLAWILLNILA